MRPHEELIAVGEKPVALQLRSRIRTLSLPLYPTVFLDNNRRGQLIVQKIPLNYLELIARLILMAYIKKYAKE